MTRWRPYQPPVPHSNERLQAWNDQEANGTETGDLSEQNSTNPEPIQREEQSLDSTRIDPAQNRYWKSSSTIALVDGAFRLHNANVPEDPVTTAIPGGHGPEDSPLAMPHDEGNSLPPMQRTSLSTARRPQPGGLFLPAAELLSLLPPFEAAGLLVDTYFDRVHWFMLIFQQNEFRRQWPQLYQRQSGQGTNSLVNAAFLSTFLVVIAIGLQYTGPYRQKLLAEHGVLPDLKDRILSTVRARLLDVMSLGSLEAAHTCVLLGTYYLYHGAPRLAWPVCGCGLRIAQALHLHRRSQQAEPRQQIETRKRCWWAIYEIETFSAVVYGYPHSIWDADCDVEPLDPSAKSQVVQSPRSFDEPLRCETSLLSYKYFMSKLSVITKAALAELYHANNGTTDRERHPQSQSHLQQTIQTVAKFGLRLQKWQSEIPLELQWDHVADKVNYSTADEIDRDIGASGPRFENHIYQLQAMTLMLAYENARILIHRPLLSYKLLDRNGTDISSESSNSANQSNPLFSSLESCRAAALKMCSIQASPILKLVSEMYAAAFVSIHTFTAGITLGILCSMDPLGPQSSMSKKGLQQVMEIQEELKIRSVAAEQGLVILQRLTKLVMQKELDVLLGTNKPMETSHSRSVAAPLEQTVVHTPQSLAKDAAAGNRDLGNTSAPGLSPSDVQSRPGALRYICDPALTEVLHDFDEALLSYAPQPDSILGDNVDNQFVWPPTLDGFPVLDQTWMWDLDKDPFVNGEDQR
ncbi:hypothetical protein ASPBRDRAFT_43903 [Aspergillus brasiliensis CBS 101740]|uniref:Xylanolytic transcriptional activator regulatory domain-containing protein n=1 Tax=Aspergillus brasiliensis (strain CBS 101740 / IMI 381727 / IBT 21946) TaxID=767769 RepID=A0A1L9UH49_ASPBC|nr:hypothetical protein ASPBRDRAFT_43903 [Aspergillus brasiliensis CBS 101740]